MTDANANTNLILRDDTILGVCQALGEDFGVSPVLLRAVAAILLLWNPAGVVAGYFTLGVVVLLTRIAFPARPWRRKKAAPAAAAEAPAEAPTEHHQLPLAA